MSYGSSSSMSNTLNSGWCDPDQLISWLLDLHFMLLSAAVGDDSDMQGNLSTEARSWSFGLLPVNRLRRIKGMKKCYVKC